jgi:hypothetical protein
VISASSAKEHFTSAVFLADLCCGFVSYISVGTGQRQAFQTFTNLFAIPPANMVDVDQSLNDKVFSALESDPYLFRRSLRFESNQGRVRLTGVVGSYYQKQMAQEVVRRLEGVTEVENNLEVCWS